MEAESHIKEWIFNILSKVNSDFNNLPPCPFAKQAYLQNKILILESFNNENLEQLLNDYEVIIYALNPSEISAEELYNKASSLSNNTIVALDDHPSYEEKVGNTILNNGRYALILVQQRDKLEQARHLLKSKGYYNNWDDEYLRSVLDV